MAQPTEQPRHPHRKYPWEAWTDGCTWRIEKGKDYKISTYSMQISLHGRAKLQTLKVRSKSFTDRSESTETEGLDFRFYKPATKERK